MLYKLLTILFKLAFNIYFKRLIVQYDTTFNSQLPTLFIANHQSSVMDALLIGILSPQPLHFLARGESFNTPFRKWLLSLFNMHPIYRKEFTPEKAHLNPKIMEEYSRLLLSGKSLLIFPEGISETAPRMRKVKTGAARIILLAETLKNDHVEIQCIPIGLNYSNPHEFRSEVFVDFGAPIKMEVYIHTYQHGHQHLAVRQLTAQIEAEIKSLTLEIEYKHLEKWVEAVDKICRKEFLKNKEIAQSVYPNLAMKKKIAAIVNYYRNNKPLQFIKIKKQIKQYQNQLKSRGLNEQKFQQLLEIKGNQILINILALPYHLFSLINAGPILLFSTWLTSKVSKRPDFKGTFLLCFGILGTLIYLPFLFGIIYFLSASLMATLIYFLIVIISIQFSLQYFPDLKMVKLWTRFSLGSFKEWSTISQLNQQRELLITEFRYFWQKYNLQA